MPDATPPEGSDLQNLIDVLDSSRDGEEEAKFLSALDKKSKLTESLVDKENDGIISMRRMWSTWILIFIGLVILFDIIIVWLYGSGVWDFKDPKVVMVVITENFLKIIGLGVLITNSLFKKIF